MNLSITFILSCVLSFPILASAQDKEIKDPVEVGKFLRSIPAYDSDMASSMAKNGMKVIAIRLHLITRKEAAEDPTHLEPGDLEIKIWSNVPEIPACQMGGSPTIFKRGSRYLPQDRTGMWLLKGKCALPS